MKKIISTFIWPITAGLLLCLSQAAKAQNIQSLSIKDFAIWGGSAAPGQLQTGQGVFLKGKNTINGNMGSNHQVNVMETWRITGNIYSGNIIDLKSKGQITGNLFSWKSDQNFSGPSISGKEGTRFIGNLTSNGPIDIRSGRGALATTITGQVAVPSAGAGNYAGPAPTGGIINTLVFPTLPLMPGITNFDNQVGNLNITRTRVVSPGVYNNFDLKGGQTITFRGPGNYVFEEIKITGNNNNIVFDLNNTTEGTINIFVKKDVQIGKIMVRAIKGNATSRIFTEVHGNGAQNNGFAFEAEARGFLPDGHFIWLGNIWAPYGGINIKGAKKATRPHINGALWSGTKVEVSENTILSYDAPAATSISFIEPYYAPPVLGKETDPDNIIGAELTALATNPDPIKTITKNEVFIFNNEGNVGIEVVSKDPNDNILKNELIALGLTGIIDNGPQIYKITGYFPVANLEILNTNPRIEFVHPWYPPINNSGQVTTQGDGTMRTNLVRSQFGLDGSGVKIGVLSDSYDSKSSAKDDVDQGELPGVKRSGVLNENGEEVQVLKDLSGNGNDEGRAMLQIVHDIAPKAKLAFRTGYLSAGDFAKGILELASPDLEGGRCDIIVDDLSYITEPFLRDGIVAQAVDQVVAQGVSYFTSAGNFGQKSYEGVFNGVPTPSILPAPAQMHKFGTADSEIYQTLRLKPGTYTIVLQWDDEASSLGDPTGVKTDMDLYLVGANNFTLFGFNRSNLFKDPFEVCPFVVKEETIAKLMIVRAAGTANVRFKYIIFRGDATIMDYNSNTSTIVGHANSNGAISVGAMFYEPRPTIPVWPAVSSFSSRGGTFIKENNSFITRNKPDIVGPNGGNTTVNLGGAPFDDGDLYPNFFGTSAAAPHVAALGGLIMQGRKKFGLQTTVTPAEIRQQLISSAGRFSQLPGAFSFEGGNGFTQGDSALIQIANPRPILDTLFSEVAGSENGTEPFNVILRGRYLTSSTIIHVNGLLMPTVVSEDGKEAKALVPPIPQGEDPYFQLFNPAKSPSGLDGGFSNKKFFFSERRTVVVKPVNKSRIYSQENPVFDLEITINGIPINDPAINLTPEDLKLDPSNINVSTIATAQSKAGLYGIFVERIPALELADPLNNLFEFEFQSGTLNVKKMRLRIIPNDQTIKYGEYLDEINYKYETDLDGDGNYDFAPDEYLPEIKRLHEEYMAKNSVIVVKGLNIEEEDPLNEDDLWGMSTLASFQSVLKAKKYVLENGQLKAMVNTIDPSDIGNQRFFIETPANALVNYLDNPKSTILGNGNEDPAPKTGLLNLKALAKGDASAAMPNGQLKAMVNGQLMGMVNGELETTLDANRYAIINGNFTPVEDIVYQNGQLRAMVNGEWQPATNGQYRATVNGSYAEFDMFVEDGELKAVTNGAYMTLVNGQLRAMVNGQEVSIANGQLRAMVNGQLLPLVNNELMGIANGQLRAMVNGEMAALVNGQLMALIDGAYEEITELTLVNGQLRALINGQLRALINGQLRAMVNGEISDIDIDQVSLVNGQLRAMVNGQLRAMVNGQLKAIVNGQLRAMVNSEAIAIEKLIQLPNGQLKAMVNGNLIPIKNGQLRAMVNGQLRAMVNGELMAALINGQLTAFIDGESLEITELILENGQLKAMINGQLRALINGQLRAMVNGELTDIDVNEVSLVNGQLRAMVNGQLRAMVNGQLRAIVNGELMPAEDIQINFTVFENGQLKAMVNGQLRAMVNGQLRAMVNGQMEPVDSYVIENGQLKAIVNVNGEEEEWVFPNGQLKALVNGQLKALVNNFDVSGDDNNAKTMVLVGEDDLLQQQGDIGGMFSMAMITGINAGSQIIVPAAFINENYEVSYDYGYLDILQAPVTVTTGNATKVYGEQNPQFNDWSLSPLAYDETLEPDDNFEGPYCEADETSNVGLYPIEFYPNLGGNYYILDDFGNLTITPKLLTVRADDKQVTMATEYEIPAPTITYDGLVGDDTEDSVCVNFVRPASPKVINDWDRTTTYSNVLINGVSNVFYATPGQNLNLSGTFISFNNPFMDCPGCYTQIHIGMGDGGGNFFSNCYEVTTSGSNGNLNAYFTAPPTPGIYYITQMGSWWYYCGEFPDPSQQVANVEKLAIAVVIVNAVGLPSGEDKISASVNADYTSGPGNYPITLAGCANYNPNYNVVLVDGTLRILPEPGAGELDCGANSLYTIHWRGNGNFMNNNEDFGTPVGGVTANGEPKAGSGSFSFNGNGYIDVGTEGSVSGTGDFAVSAWVKTTSENPMVIINQREDGNINGEYMLKIGGDHWSGTYNSAFAGRAYFMMYDDYADVVDILSNTLVNDGNWHHVRGERIGTTINLYVDGVLEATATTAGVVNLSSTIRTFIGYDQLAQEAIGEGSYFEGLIDDVKVEICMPEIGTSGAEILTVEAVIEPKAKKEIITKDLVYPNPASNTIRLQLTEDVVNINEIQVLSTMGKVNKTMTRKIDDGVYEVNISGLPKGLYFLKARTPGGIKTFKFVKM